MAVAYQSVGAVSEQKDDSVETSAPAGVTSGDLLVLCVFIRSLSAITITTPTGWTQQQNNTNSGNETIAIYTRIADGTGSDTPTVTLSATPASGWFAVIVRLDGHDGTTPVDTSGYNEGTSGTVAINQLTVSRNGSIYVGFCAAISGSDNNITWPGSWIEIVDHYNSAFARSDFGVGYDAVNSGTTAAESVTNLNNVVTQFTGVVIQPPAAGGGGNPWYYYNQQG